MPPVYERKPVSKANSSVLSERSANSSGPVTRGKTLLSKIDSGALAPAPPGFTSSVVECERSHYAYTGGKSASAILAAEASLLLLSAEPGFPHATAELIERILQTAENADVNHLKLSNLLTSIDRYKRGLTSVKAESQIELCDLQRLAQAIGQLEAFPFAVLLTKSSESIALIAQSASRYIVFDSQKRSNTRGACFVVNNSMPAAIKAVQGIWSVTDFGSDVGVQAEYPNLVGYILVKRTVVPIDKLPELQLCPIQLSELRSQIARASKVSEEQNAVINELRRKLADCQDDLRHQFDTFNQLKSGIGEFFTRFIEIQSTASTQQQNAYARLAQDFQLPNPGCEVAGACGPARSEDSFSCIQCKQSVPAGFQFDMKTCSHQLCYPCAVELFNEKIMMNHYPIRCPTCSKAIDSEEISQVLEGSHRDMFDRNSYLQR